MENRFQESLTKRVQVRGRYLPGTKHFYNRTSLIKYDYPTNYRSHLHNHRTRIHRDGAPRKKIQNSSNSHNLLPPLSLHDEHLILRRNRPHITTRNSQRNLHLLRMDRPNIISTLGCRRRYRPHGRQRHQNRKLNRRQRIPKTTITNTKIIPLKHIF